MNKDKLIKYFDLYSQGSYEEAINSCFTEEASFWNTRIALCGRQKIIDWLNASHVGYLEKLSPVNFIIDSKGAAIELEQEFHATEDMSHFFIRPMKKGEIFKTRGISLFLKFEDGKICSSKEYRWLYKCDPKLFMT
ncbi:MAG: hypothetical protein K8T10_03435 [Candidatus Eremiobacteraeota bacterium]|nr:hypothetical protein [Candidatus Eremiobacteraeota bacterium]